MAPPRPLDREARLAKLMSSACYGGDDSKPAVSEESSVQTNTASRDSTEKENSTSTSSGRTSASISSGGSSLQKPISNRTALQKPTSSSTVSKPSSLRTAPGDVGPTSSIRGGTATRGGTSTGGSRTVTAGGRPAASNRNITGGQSASARSSMDRNGRGANTGLSSHGPRGGRTIATLHGSTSLHSNQTPSAPVEPKPTPSSAIAGALRTHTLDALNDGGANRPFRAEPRPEGSTLRNTTQAYRTQRGTTAARIDQVGRNTMTEDQAERVDRARAIVHNNGGSTHEGSTSRNGPSFTLVENTNDNKKSNVHTLNGKPTTSSSTRNANGNDKSATSSSRGFRLGFGKLLGKK